MSEKNENQKTDAPKGEDPPPEKIAAKQADKNKTFQGQGKEVKK